MLFDQIRERILFMTPLAEVPNRVDWSVPVALCEKDREEHHSKIAKCVKKMIEGQIRLSIGLGPEWDARQQSRKRINSFAAASFVNSTLPDPSFYIGLYREIAQRRLGAEYTAKWEICRKLAEAKEKVATHTIWGPWPTTGGFECSFQATISIVTEWIGPRSFLWTMRWTAMITISNQLACVAFTTAVCKIPAHSSAILCL